MHTCLWLHQEIEALSFAKLLEHLRLAWKGLLIKREKRYFFSSLFSSLFSSHKFSVWHTFFPTPQKKLGFPPTQGYTLGLQIPLYKLIQCNKYREDNSWWGVGIFAGSGVVNKKQNKVWLSSLIGDMKLVYIKRLIELLVFCFRLYVIPEFREGGRWFEAWGAEKLS